MLNIYIIRHGETDHNKNQVFYGHTDTVLNDNGIKQAQKLREYFSKTEAPSTIFCSPLKRAMMTANVINEISPIVIETSDYLKEQNFGRWENLNFKQIRDKYEDEYQLWRDNVAYRIIDGESHQDLHDRVGLFAAYLQKAKCTGSVIVVSHHGALRSLVSHLLGFSLSDSWRFRMENGSVSKITMNDEGFAYLCFLNLQP